MSEYEKIELTNMCMIYDNNGNVFQAECDTILLARKYCVYRTLLSPSRLLA